MLGTIWVKQSPGQSIQNLAEQIEKVTKEYVNINATQNEEIKELQENLACTKFLEALRVDIRFEILKLELKILHRQLRLHRI